MRITQRKLTEIIETEVAAALREFSSEEKPKKKDRKVSTAAADEGPGDDDDQPTSGGGVDPIGDSEPVKGGMNSQESDEEDSEEQADEDEDDAVDAGGDASENPSGAVNNEVSGKTVQAITIEPKSELLKGAAKEVVITFNESTDPLRIIVTPTGQVKFAWRGQLHDLP